MNSETIDLIQRPYPEIVDDLLTALVGGVVNEPIIFDLKADLYRLAQPAKDVRGITGTIEAEGTTDGIHHTFLKEVDFVFDGDKSAVVWQDGGHKPKDETKFYVDYFLKTSRSPLSDINVGSVTRTLSEAIGREIATLYQEINQAYLSGFIDTARGKALDLVVSILHVTRKTRAFAVGQATFFRDSASDGTVTIAEGTELSTDKGEVVFETTEPRTLQRGQARIEAPIRAGNKFKGEAGKVEAGKITTISQVIAGISRVSNFEPTILAAEDESDEDLRLRAKAALQAFGKGTVQALRKAVIDSGAKVKELSDPNNDKARTPGTVNLLIESEAARFPSVVAAVNDTRAAGVLVSVLAHLVFVKLRIVATIPSGTAAAGKDKFVGEIIVALQKFFEKLGPAQPVKGEDLLKTIKSVKNVTKPTIVDVRTSRADISPGGTDPLIDALVVRLSRVNTSDSAALRNALQETIESQTKAAASGGLPIPDRSLVEGLAKDGRSRGKRATDGEIEAGEFLVVPPSGFSLILDMEPADIILQES